MLGNGLTFFHLYNHVAILLILGIMCRRANFGVLEYGHPCRHLDHHILGPYCYDKHVWSTWIWGM